MNAPWRRCETPRPRGILLPARHCGSGNRRTSASCLLGQPVANRRPNPARVPEQRGDESDDPDYVVEAPYWRRSAQRAQRRRSRSAVHLETNVALVGDQRLACIDSDAHADWTISQPVADLGCCRGSGACFSERREERVALRANLDTRVPAQGCPDDDAVGGEELRIPVRYSRRSLVELSMSVERKVTVPQGRSSRGPLLLRRSEKISSYGDCERDHRGAVHRSSGRAARSGGRPVFSSPSTSARWNARNRPVATASLWPHPDLEHAKFPVRQRLTTSFISHEMTRGYPYPQKPINHNISADRKAA